MPTGGRHKHSDLAQGRFSTAVVEKLFTASRYLFAVKPWTFVKADQVLRMDIPTLGIDGACLSIIVLGHLPKEQHEQARSTLRAAWKLDADEGIRKLEQYASWLEREWPSAAGSLREGLSELFTVNRLGLPKPLRRCLTTTNIIDSSHAGVRQHTNRVSRWQSEEMAVRWAAVTFRETEKHYRRITGYEHLWMLKAHLDEEDGVLAELQKAG